MTTPEQGRAPKGAFGILLIDKPAGPTSHDVVNWVRWVLHERSVGHCGTLDPAATGLLVICVGAATKLVEHLTAVDKRYVARFVLGTSTTTADAQGEVVDEVELPADAVDRAIAALPSLVGNLEIPPPLYSAVKVDGRRAHALARAGETPELPLRPMTVERLELVGRGPNWIDADLTVSKGTYVRSLAEELGRRVELPAHLGQLRRLACGDLTLDDPTAVTGLVGVQLPELEGRAPRWRIEVPAEAAEAVDAAETDHARDRAEALLRAQLASAWLRLPFPASVLEGDDYSVLLDRMIQGQRLRGDERTCAALGLSHPPESGLLALVDRAGGRMLIVRYEPEQQRIAPNRVLRF